MTTASQKESVEEPNGPLSKIGDMVEDIIEDILDKKPEEQESDPKTSPPEPDPCCGPINTK